VLCCRLFEPITYLMSTTRLNQLAFNTFQVPITFGVLRNARVESYPRELDSRGLDPHIRPTWAWPMAISSAGFRGETYRPAVITPRYRIIKLLSSAGHRKPLHRNMIRHSDGWSSYRNIVAPAACRGQAARSTLQYFDTEPVDVVDVPGDQRNSEGSIADNLHDQLRLCCPRPTVITDANDAAGCLRSNVAYPHQRNMFRPIDG
jgi:hypothetical protein